MKIEPKQIKVREIFESFADNGDDGVFAYGGRLAVRPPYQREFVYDNEQAEAVIQTVLKSFPLNVNALSMKMAFPVVLKILL